MPLTAQPKLFACVRAKSLQSCLTLCDLMDCSLPDSSVPGILQARILEWIAVPSSRGSSRSRDRTHVSYVSCIAGGFFTRWAIRHFLWSTRKCSCPLRAYSLVKCIDTLFFINPSKFECLLHKCEFLKILYISAPLGFFSGVEISNTYILEAINNPFTHF